MAKALNTKNLVEAFINLWGDKRSEEDFWTALYEMRNQGFLDTYTLNSFSDKVADLYCDEAERVWKNGNGKVVYKCNETTGYFEKAQG